MLLALAGVPAASAQSIGIGTTAPDASAALEVASTSQGFLPPRLTYAQRTGIAHAAAGLLVYQSNANASPAAPAGYYYYTGNAWLPLQTQGDNLGNHTATQNLNLGTRQLVGGTAANPGTVGLSLIAAGTARIRGIALPTPDDRLILDDGHLRVGGFVWRNASFDRFVKFGDGSFVSIGEAGQDDTMQLTANRFTLGPGSVGIGTVPTARLDVDGTTRLRGDLRVEGSAQLGWTLVSQSFSAPGKSGFSFSLRCPTGMRVLGGGGGHRDANAAANDIVINYNGPDPAAAATAWRVHFNNNSGSSRAIRMYCICARIAP